MLFVKACSTIFLVIVVAGIVVGDDEVIDLQELLRDVSAAMKTVSSTLDSFSTTMKDISSIRNDFKTALETCRPTEKPPVEKKPVDCADIWYAGERMSGVYTVWPKGTSTDVFEVYCDMTTEGGGWTVFQRRGDFGNPVDYFYKTWNEYKTGFGKLEKEFWLGNDKIFTLTSQTAYELRVDLWDMDSKYAYAKYSQFKIENESAQYLLRLGSYSGTAGDSFGYHNGQRFSTKDRKNDQRSLELGRSCAELYKGAWWYDHCYNSNLNGLNLRGPGQGSAEGITWNEFRKNPYSLGSTEMKIRPIDFSTRA